jgi:pimeloyl-ACP methyl ester carboxylesterase
MPPTATTPSGVQRELVTLDAPAPPENPVKHLATPAELDRARFLRYRLAGGASALQAVVVCMPGMPAGAMAFDELARRLVTLADGAVEVWAVDRRANLLEDLTGMQAAEQAGDPDLAWDYYDHGRLVEGRRFSGPPDRNEYMSEWGLATAVADLRAILDRVPRERQRTNLVLLGHSFGAAVVQAYAAWDLEGRAAGESLAGLVLLDGGVHMYAPISEAAYLRGGTSTAPGLEELRQGKGLYLSYYGFGLEAFLTVEITAMSAWLTPRREIRNTHTDRFATLLFLEQPPRLTAAAMVGFTIDDASSPLPGMRASCGGPDGPVEPFTHPLTGETRQRPPRASAGRLYDWRDFDQVTPREKTSVRVLARVAHEGPSNRLEWYLPSRLALDVNAARSLSLRPDDWQWRHGLRAGRNDRVDAPVLALLAGRGLVTSAALLEGYRRSLAPRVGDGRPRAGAGRDDGDGFKALLLEDYAHDDLVHATAPEAETELYRPLLGWILANTSGELTLDE